MCSLQWVRDGACYRTELQILSEAEPTKYDLQALQDLINAYMDHQLNPAIVHIGNSEKVRNSSYEKIRAMETLADLKQMESLSTGSSFNTWTPGEKLVRANSQTPQGKEEPSEWDCNSCGGSFDDIDPDEGYTCAFCGSEDITPVYKKEEH